MNIRPASFRDLGRVEQLYREATAEEEQPTVLSDADSPVPQRTLLRLWHGVNMTLSSMVPQHDPGATLYVAEDGEAGIVGFVQAQAPQGRRNAWLIVNLCVASTPRGHFARTQLVEHLCNDGIAHGVRRFHVRVPVEHPLVPVFLEQGFRQYATEQILYCDRPLSPKPGPSALLRPARREDVAGIHLLYLRTTPSQVAEYEGTSMKAWQAAFALGWMSRIGRDDVRHLVAERPGIDAWVAVKPGTATRPTTIALMCDGTDPTLRAQVVDEALATLPPGPASCVLRHYDSELIRELQQRSFDVLGAQLLFVREMGVKVPLRSRSSAKQPVLVHAGLTQSVSSSIPPLRVVHVNERRLS